MRRPSLVASDVDGTLLGADGAPSDRTRRVLGRLAESGVPFVLATGRPPRWVPRVCDAIGIHGLCVAANGAVLYDAAHDRVLDTATLGVDVLAEVVDGLRDAVPGSGLAVERVGRGAFDRPEAQFVSEPGYLHAWPDGDDTRVAPAELVGEPVTKVLARHPEWTSEEMARSAHARIGHLVDVTFSASGGLVECSAKGVTKAHGLTLAAGRLGVDAGDALAFGDMPNDREMLLWAGHGVAVANAHPALVAIAGEVTASNVDDGVASVLERWF